MSVLGFSSYKFECWYFYVQDLANDMNVFSFVDPEKN